MFAYCLNNPVNGADPVGYWSFDYQEAIGFSLLFWGLAILAAVPTGGASLAAAAIGVSVSTTTVIAAGTSLTIIGTAIIIDSPTTATISTAKTKGKERVRHTDLQNESDAEVIRKARDKSLSPQERKRYIEEEKGRGLRNRAKRRG